MDIIQGYYVRVDGLINEHTKSAHEITGSVPLMEYYHEGNGLCEQYYEATFDSLEDAKKYLSHVDETRKLREAQHIALEEFIKNALTYSDGEIYSSVSENDGLLSFTPIKHTQYVVDLVRGEK